MKILLKPSANLRDFLPLKWMVPYLVSIFVVCVRSIKPDKHGKSFCSEVGNLNQTSMENLFVAK